MRKDAYETGREEGDIYRCTRVEKNKWLSSSETEGRCKTTTDREHRNGNRRKHCIEAVYNLTQKGTMHVDLLNPANEDWQSGKFCYWLLTFPAARVEFEGVSYRIGAGGLNISRYLRTSEE